MAAVEEFVPGVRSAVWSFVAGVRGHGDPYGGIALAIETPQHADRLEVEPQVLRRA